MHDTSIEILALPCNRAFTEQLEIIEVYINCIVENDVRYDFRIKRCSVDFYAHMCFKGFMGIYIICIYLRIFVSNNILISHDVRVTLTRRVLLVERELLTLPDHVRSSHTFSGVLVIHFLDFCLVFF